MHKIQAHGDIRHWQMKFTHIADCISKCHTQSLKIHRHTNGTKTTNIATIMNTQQILITAHKEC